MKTEKKHRPNALSTSTRHERNRVRFFTRGRRLVTNGKVNPYVNVVLARGAMS